MYNREQASKLKQEFWTTFGQYLAPQLGADGQKVNWINYKTGHRNFFFRMDADNKEAFIGIVILQKNADLRMLFYEQLEELRGALHGMLEEEWLWETDRFDSSGRPYCSVYTILEGVSVYKREDWPVLIRFFKPRLIALDEFWSMAQYHFLPLKGL